MAAPSSSAATISPFAAAPPMARSATRWAGARRTARELRLPIVRLVDGTGGGGSVKTNAALRRSYVPANPDWDVSVELLSQVPVVAAALGPVAGLGAARVAASHFSVMVRGSSQLFVAGPPVVHRAFAREVEKEELGGSHIHAHESGAVDNEVETEEEAFEHIRRFLSYLPSSVWEAPPRYRARPTTRSAARRADFDRPARPAARLQHAKDRRARRRRRARSSRVADTSARR